MAKQVVVHGEVQGVNFREATRREAESAGVSGWVRNRDDGTVEARFEGDDDAVARMVEFCRSGPSSAEVEDVEVSGAADEGAVGFEVR